MRDGLRNLYSVIKGADAHVRFAFLTGVSKFSKVSIFSGLNNLNDITVDAALLGAVRLYRGGSGRVFAPELEGLDREEIRPGTTATTGLGEAVYNPFDLLLLFQEREFRPWWFETGTPTFLVDLLTQRGYFTPDLAQLRAIRGTAVDLRCGPLSPEALLWQTGYLTFTGSRQIGARREYTLGYPNLEVRSRTERRLAQGADGRPDAGRATPSAGSTTCWSAAISRPYAQHIASLFAAIPHQWHDGHPHRPVRGLLRQRLLQPPGRPGPGPDAGGRQQPRPHRSGVCASTAASGCSSSRWWSWHPRAAHCSRSRTVATRTSTAPRASRFI